MNIPGSTSVLFSRAEPVWRIASLVPSVTELLFALGLGPWVVARTGYCVHPADAVGRVPKVGGTKTVNLDKLRRLAPTHVIVNIDENRAEDAAAIAAFAPNLIVTHPGAPSDVPGLVDQLQAAFATAPGLPERAAALRQAVQDALSAVSPGQFVPQRALVLIWHAPWMTVARDTYVSRLLAQVGWSTWPAVHGGERGAARYPVLAGDEPWLAEVQQVLLPSEPYAFDDTHVPLARALCPSARVRRVDGEWLTWHGPRTAQALHQLAALAADPGPG